jgi:hypothetical protein
MNTNENEKQIFYNIFLNISEQFKSSYIKRTDNDERY